MKKILLAVAVACVFVTSAVRAEPIVPDELPQQVGVLIEAADINTAATELQKFVSQVSPGTMIPAPGMMLPQFVFKSTQPATVDLSKPVQMLVMLPPLHEQPAVVFSVTDKNAYLNSIVLPKKETDGNVHVYQGRGQDYNVAVEGKRAVFSPSKEVAKSVGAMLAQGKFGAEPILNQGHIALAVRPASAMEQLKQGGMDLFGMIRQQMQAQAAAAGDENVAKTMKVAEIQLQALQQLIQQTQALTIAVEFSQQAIVFNDKAQAVEGSGLAAYLQSIPDGELQTTRHMPADAILFYGTRFGDLKPVYNWVHAAINDADLQVENLDTVMGLMEKWVDAMGNEMAQAVSVTDDGKLSAVGAVAMDDTSGIEALLEGAGEMARAMTSFQGMAGSPKMELTVTPDAQQYNGVSLHEIAMDVDLPEGEMPDEVLQIQKAVFSLFGGLDSSSWAAIIDGDYVYTQGAGSLHAIKAAIDRDGGLEGAPALAAAKNAADEQAVMVGFLSVAESSNFVIDYLMEKFGQNVPPNMQNIRLQPADPLVFSSGVEDGNVATFKTVFPVSIAKSAFQAVMQFQMAMQQQRMQGGGPGAAPPALP